MRRFAILAGVCSLLTVALVGDAAAARVAAHASLAAPPAPGSAVHQQTLGQQGCPGADDPGAGIAVQEAAMRCLINEARDSADLPRFGDSRKLDGSASNKGADILRCNQFSHEACGRDFLYWFRRSGYLKRRCWWAGENLAWGTGELGSARSILRAWLRSPPHRANLLGDSYDELGISLRIGSLSGRPNAHVWVNHFGRHC